MLQQPPPTSPTLTHLEVAGAGRRRAPGRAAPFTIAELDEPHHLVWTKPDSAWSWVLHPVEGDRTRLVTRLKVRYRLAPSVLLTVPLIELGDFAMMRKMLLTLRRRVTAATGSRPA